MTDPSPPVEQMARERILEALSSRRRDPILAALGAIEAHQPLDAQLFAALVDTMALGSSDLLDELPDGAEFAPLEDHYEVCEVQAVDAPPLSVSELARKVLQHVDIIGDTANEARLAEMLGRDDFSPFYDFRPETLIGRTVWTDELASLDRLVPIALSRGRVHFGAPSGLTPAGIRHVVRIVLESHQGQAALFALSIDAAWAVVLLDEITAFATSGHDLPSRHGRALFSGLVRTGRDHRAKTIAALQALAEHDDPTALMLLAYYGARGGAKRLSAYMAEHAPSPDTTMLFVATVSSASPEARSFPWQAFLEWSDLRPKQIVRTQTADRPAVRDHLWSLLVAGTLGESPHDALHAGFLLLVEKDERSEAAAGHMVGLFRDEPLHEAWWTLCNDASQRLSMMEPPPAGLGAALLAYCHRHEKKFDGVSGALRNLAYDGLIDRATVRELVEWGLAAPERDLGALSSLVSWLGDEALTARYKAALPPRPSKRQR